MNENAAHDSDNIDNEPHDHYQQIHKPFWKQIYMETKSPNKTLDTYKRAFKMNLLEDTMHKVTKPNLTRDQWSGLLELRKNPNIVIKKADKGSAVIIMNTTDYLREGYRQLSDSNFYTKLHHDPTQEISERICKTLTEMRQCKLITEKNFDFLNIKNPKAGRFYLLPKIHKKTSSRETNL